MKNLHPRTKLAAHLATACLALAPVALAVDPPPDGGYPNDNTVNGSIIQSFPVGPAPWGMAFDDANIWVTSVNSDTITKLRASDGTLLGTFPAGGQTIFAVFDGVYVWVTNLYNNTVTRLRASDGTLQGTFPVGLFPTGILFDGTNIWTANQFENTVTKLRASDGVVLGYFPSQWESNRTGL